MAIPAGFSQVSLKHSILSAGGIHQAITTLGVVGSPNTSMANDIGSNWNTNVWLVLGSSTATFDSCEVRDSVNASEINFNEQGVLTGEPALPSSCILVQRRSNQIGRKHRGRMYVPGCSYDATWLNDGNMSSGSVTDYTAAFVTFMNALVTDGYDPVILHADGSTPTAQESIAVSQTCATQRRRLR